MAISFQALKNIEISSGTWANLLQHNIQADGNFQFRPHICVYVNFFLALKFSYLYKHRIRHENQVSACKPSLGVWGVGLWDGNQIY